jgi:acyl dehydratase
VTSGNSRPGFDPARRSIVPPRTFEQLHIGEVFRAPSRTVTEAHSSAFQAVSADNHPLHYDIEWARAHGHTAPVVHGLQVLAFTAPGATLFPHVVGESFIAFAAVSCTFHGEVHAGDTLYPEIQITKLTPQGDKGMVTAAVSVYNQRRELVLDGEHTYLLRRSAGAPETVGRES